MPITPNQYKKLTEAAVKGKQVRSLVPLRNGYSELPAGTLYTILRKYEGYELISEECKCCGAKQRVNRVRHWDLEFVV